MSFVLSVCAPCNRVLVLRPRCDGGEGSFCAPSIRPVPGVMAVKVLSGQTMQGRISSALEGLNYAILHGARIVNLSWTYWDAGLGGQAVVENAFRAAGELHDVLILGAAGNSGVDLDSGDSGGELDQVHLTTVPCGLSSANVVCVGAHGPSESGADLGESAGISDFSNFGTMVVHLAAPGENLVGPVPMKRSMQNLNADGLEEAMWFDESKNIWYRSAAVAEEGVLGPVALAEARIGSTGLPEILVDGVVDSGLEEKLVPGFFAFNGTSGSTALASGVAALVLSFRPGLGVSQLKEVLLSSVTVGGFHKVWSGGRLNAGAAMTFARTVYPTGIPPATVPPGSLRWRFVRLTDLERRSGLFSGLAIFETDIFPKDMKGDSEGTVEVIKHAKIFFVNSEGKILGGAAVATCSLAPDKTEHSCKIPIVSIPPGAKSAGVYLATPKGLGLTSKASAILLDDVGEPEADATNLQVVFADDDAASGKLRLRIGFNGASGEGDITHYNIYQTNQYGSIPKFVGSVGVSPFGCLLKTPPIFRVEQDGKLTVVNAQAVFTVTLAKSGTLSSGEPWADSKGRLLLKKDTPASSSPVHQRTTLYGPGILTVEKLNLESGYDRIIVGGRYVFTGVFDPSSSTSGPTSGNDRVVPNRPPAIVVPHGQTSFEFLSDGSSAAEGFEMHFVPVSPHYSVDVELFELRSLRSDFLAVTPAWGDKETPIQPVGDYVEEDYVVRPSATPFMKLGDYVSRDWADGFLPPQNQEVGARFLHSHRTRKFEVGGTLFSP